MLELESPKRITADPILIPPNFHINLKANLIDTVYQADDAANGIVKVTRDGKLKSGDAIGRDLIIVSVLRRCGDEHKVVEFLCFCWDRHRQWIKRCPYRLR